MDKKKIYIIVIVVCLAVTAGVLYYGFFSNPTTEVPTDLAPTTINSDGNPTQARPSGGDVSNIPTAQGIVEYPVPSVFPQDTSLDLSVYSSSKFSNLQDYTPLTVTPEEMGRENPFAPYAGN